MTDAPDGALSVLRVTTSETAPSLAQDSVPEAEAPAPRSLATLLPKGQAAVWACALVFFVVACAATVMNAPGEYVRDNRFDFFWAPDRVVGSLTSIWDPHHGLGLFRWDFFPSVVFPLALRELGVPPWLIERLFHATLLAIGATGTVALLRVFRPRVGPEHIVAGLLYAFNPVTAIFLLPSGLFFGYALAPWLLFVFIRGVVSGRPWRWAAWMALMVFASGVVNHPGLPGIALAAIPIIPMLVYLVAVTRTTRLGIAIGWLARAALLTLLVSAAALASAAYGSSTLSENLAKTEAPGAVAVASSWTESWRGLGFWLVYLGKLPFAALAQTQEYVSSVHLIVATFAIPVVALLTILRSHWRARIVFGFIMLVGVATMVGAYPTTDSTPFGRALLSAFESGPPFSGLRNTYKGSSALALGVSVLCAVGIVSAVRAFSQRRYWLRPIIVVAFILVAIVASTPFWTGSLYEATTRMTKVPGYWDAAISWLNNQPGQEPVLLVPSTVTARYTWGSPGDDLFEALLDRPVVTRAQLSRSLGTAQSANLIAAIVDNVEGGVYEPGSLGPVARRLGIRYVMVRNDLLWARTDRPSPDSFNALRRDADLVRQRTFGRPGQGVVARDNSTRRVPPVEVFEVRGWTPIVRAATAPALLVSGDGAAWPPLASAGDLDNDGPVRYTAAMSANQLSGALDSGSRLVITDTNRRRVESILRDGARPGYGYTLTESETGNGEPDDLFGRAGSQSVATFVDAAAESASSYGSLSVVPEPSARPSNAFDGDERTAWTAGGFFTDPTGEWVQVRFRHPVAVSRLTLVAAPHNRDSRHVTRARVRLSNGAEWTARLHRGRADVRFPRTRTRAVRVMIDRVAGHGVGATGFAEIAVPGVDLREFIQVPDDVARSARHSPALAQRVAKAPIAYVFIPLRAAGGGIVEPNLRRRFDTFGERDYEITGRASQGPDLDAAAKRTFKAEFSSDTRFDCGDTIVRVDGRPVAVRFLDDPNVMIYGKTARFVSCSDQHLQPGAHTVENEAGIFIDRLRLSSGARRDLPTTRPEPRINADTVTRETSSVAAHGRGSGPTAVVVGQSFDQTWRMELNGRDVGEPIPLDTMNGWEVKVPEKFAIRADVGAQGPYILSVVVSGAALLVCLFLVLRPARPRRNPSR
jgi:arabinofuranan 3-O-arabinosyltransferase